MLIVIVGFVIAILAVAFNRSKLQVQISPGNGTPQTQSQTLDTGGAY
ncbi:MAG: hypothetical protein KKD44_25800 [Proteobacteria bacterium]|nr:hypothetical protein [Pseudomonadota bacterium]